MFIAITKVVFNKMSSTVAYFFKLRCQRWRSCLQAKRSPWLSNCCHTRTNRVLSCNKSCSTCGLAWLCVMVCKLNTFISDTIDIRSCITHGTLSISRNILSTNVVAPNNKNIRLVCGNCNARCNHRYFFSNLL